MSYQKKVNETLYRGTSRWLRVSQDYVPKEGEDVIETDDIVKKVPRVGFEITYLSYFFNLFRPARRKKVCRRKIYLAAQKQ